MLAWLAGTVPACWAAADSHTDVQLAVEASRSADGAGGQLSMIVVPFVWRHRSGAWTVQGELPFVRIHSATPTVPGIGAIGAPAITPSTTAGTQSHAGLGDVWLKLSRELRAAGANETGIDLTIKIKAATGDEQRGLGTGGTDVALQLEMLRSLGPMVLFGHLGYRRTGDVAGFAPYRDPWYGELGGMHRTAGGCEHGAYYSHRQPIGRLGALGDATVFSACRLGTQRWQVYLTRGVQPASPQWALGLAVRERF